MDDTDKLKEQANRVEEPDMSLSELIKTLQLLQGEFDEDPTVRLLTDPMGHEGMSPLGTVMTDEDDEEGFPVLVIGPDHK